MDISFMLPFCCLKVSQMAIPNCQRGQEMQPSCMPRKKKRHRFASTGAVQAIRDILQMLILQMSILQMIKWRAQKDHLTCRRSCEYLGKVLGLAHSTLLFFQIQGTSLRKKGQRIFHIKQKNLLKGNIVEIFFKGFLGGSCC